jgi:chromosome condensin MukBEF MukE localization factor
VKRLFWLALGATVGILVMRKVSRAIEKMTPHGIAEGIGAGLADIADSISEFATDVRHAMSEREAQLREDTGMDGNLGKVPPPQQAAG